MKTIMEMQQTKTAETSDTPKIIPMGIGKV